MTRLIAMAAGRRARRRAFTGLRGWGAGGAAATWVRTLHEVRILGVHPSPATLPVLNFEPIVTRKLTHCSLAALLGALLAVSAEMDADVAVEMARYGIGGGRAQRRADAKTQRRARRAK